MHFVTAEDEKRTSTYIEKEYRRAGLTVKDGHVVADGKLAQAPVWVAGSGWIRGQDPSVKGVSHLFIGDVRKLTSERVLKAIGMQPGELDLIAGGPPCQGFSKAGKQNICDPRNSLIYEFARFIQEMQPRSFVMEEVPEVGTMMDPDGVPVLEKFKRLVEPAGFEGYEAFKRIAHGSPTRGAALRSNTPRSLNGKAKRERKNAVPAAKAPPPGGRADRPVRRGRLNHTPGRPARGANPSSLRHRKDHPMRITIKDGRDAKAVITSSLDACRGKVRDSSEKAQCVISSLATAGFEIARLPKPPGMAPSKSSPMRWTRRARPAGSRTTSSASTATWLLTTCCSVSTQPATRSFTGLCPSRSGPRKARR